MSIGEMNIFQRMAAITGELQTVAKNLNVSTGGGKGYKAVSERDIIDAVKPLEMKYGVYSYPCARKVLESHILESESEYNGKVTKKTTFFTRMETTYRFVNVDNPDEFIETVAFSEGIDSQDKGSGKGMTYSDKYCLMKCYKISTGDDPDQTASVEESYTARYINYGEEPPRRNEPVPVCADCNAEIKVQEHDFSVRAFGRPLCRNCQRKARAK